MGFAREVADEIVFMDHGQIIEQAPVTDLAPEKRIPC
jgi:ABC-type polar amino acid transport system ATPase subunit